MAVNLFLVILFVHYTNNTNCTQAFDNWNKTELDSFLIEITANILKYRDSDGTHLLPKIRDSAGQKGTGKWTAISALEYGTPVTLIGKRKKCFGRGSRWSPFTYSLCDSLLSVIPVCHDDIAKKALCHACSDFSMASIK